MEMISQLAAVAGVLTILAVCLHFVRRRAVPFGLGRSRGERRLKSVERLPLSPQHSLHLVRVGDRLMLIAVSPAGCSVLEQAGGLDAPSPREVGR